MHEDWRKQPGMVCQEFSWAIIEGLKAAETIEYDNTVNKKEFKQSWMRWKKELWKNERIYEQLVREIPETTDEKETWNWLRKTDLKIETEAMFCGLEEQIIRRNYVKHKIDKTAQSPPCTIYEKKVKKYLIFWAKVKGITKCMQGQTQFCQNSSLEIVSEIQPEKKWKLV